jgi:hypothetical protein
VTGVRLTSEEAASKRDVLCICGDGRCAFTYSRRHKAHYGSHLSPVILQAPAEQ